MKYVTDVTNGKMTVSVHDETGELVRVPADDRKHAEKLVKQAAKDGWESITPEALAAQTKAAAAKEKARVEAGKASSEPEPPKPTKGQPAPKNAK
jgi:hypothetical protein